MADHVYAWQTANRIRILERTRRLIEKRSLDPRMVATGFLLPALEAMGSVENDDLEELWAQLLAEAINNESSQKLIHIETLRRLSPHDAIILSRLAERLREGVHARTAATGRPGSNLDAEWHYLAFRDRFPLISGITQDVWEAAISRFEAINLIEREASRTPTVIANALRSYFDDLGKVTSSTAFPSRKEIEMPDPIRRLGRDRLERLKHEISNSTSEVRAWHVSRYGMDAFRSVGLTKLDNQSPE